MASGCWTAPIPRRPDDRHDRVGAQVGRCPHERPEGLAAESGVARRDPRPRGLLDDPDASGRLNALARHSRKCPSPPSVGQAVAALLGEAGKLPAIGGSPTRLRPPRARNARRVPQGGRGRRNRVQPRLLAVTEHRGGALRPRRPDRQSVNRPWSPRWATLTRHRRGRSSRVDQGLAQRSAGHARTQVRRGPRPLSWPGSHPGRQGPLLRLGDGLGQADTSRPRPAEVSQVAAGGGPATSRNGEDQRIAAATAVDRLPPGRPRRGGVAARNSSPLGPRPSRSLRDHQGAWAESASGVGRRAPGRADRPAHPGGTKATAIGVLLRRPVATTQRLNAIEKPGGRSADSDPRSRPSRWPPTPSARSASGARALLAEAADSAERRPAESHRGTRSARPSQGDPTPPRQESSFSSSALRATPMAAEGGKVEPDLTGMAVHPKEELLGPHPRPEPERRGELSVSTTWRPPTARSSSAS